MKWPASIPYPISVVRTIFQMSAISMSLFLLVGDDRATVLPLIFLSLFGWMPFVVVPIALMMAAHWIFQTILHRLKGVRKPQLIESLWEGIFGWMTAIFSFTFTTFFFIVPTVLAIDVGDRYYNNWSLPSQIDESSFVLSCSIIYGVVTVYLYQLEHLIRHRTSQLDATPPKKSTSKQQKSATSSSKANKKRRSPTRSNSNKVPSTKIQSPKASSTASKSRTKPPVNVTPDDIDLELQILKENHNKKSK